MPGLQSASLSAKLLKALGGESVLGPYMLGLERPVQIAPMTASASDLVMLAVLAAGDAHARQRREDQIRSTELTGSASRNAAMIAWRCARSCTSTSRWKVWKLPSRWTS